MTRYLNEELYCELRLRFSLKFRAQKNRTVGIKRARERNIRRWQKNAKRLVTRFYFPVYKMADLSFASSSGLETHTIPLKERWYFWLCILITLIITCSFCQRMLFSTMFKMKREEFSDNEDFGVRSAEQLVSACLDGFVQFRFRSIFDLQSCLFVDV